MSKVQFCYTLDTNQAVQFPPYMSPGFQTWQASVTTGPIQPAGFPIHRLAGCEWHLTLENKHYLISMRPYMKPVSYVHHSVLVSSKAVFVYMNPNLFSSWCAHSCLNV
jgi:hypothetical protein